MSDVDIHHLAAAYALDALDQRERMAFEAHYPSCEVCHADVLDFRSTLAQLADAAPVAPPASVKQGVMAEIAQTRQLSPVVPAAVADLAERRRRRQRSLSVALAAAAAVVVFAAGAVVTNNPSTPAYASALAEVLASDDSRVAELGGEAAGTVRVAWTEAGARAVLLGDGLPAAPDGQAYELWLIGPEGPVPMRVLDAATDGRIRATLDNVEGSPAAWGVTLEPSAGSPAPTGDILYLAQV